MVNRAITYNEIGDLDPLHIADEIKSIAPDWRRMVEGIWNPSRHVKSLSLLAGYVAGEAYSIYAVFETKALTPVSAYLTERVPNLGAVSGKYHEVFHLGGLIPLLLASMVAFAMAWCVIRGTAFALADSD